MEKNPTKTSPDLTAFDYIVINSSAGKDSQAMLDYLVEIADAAGVARDRLIVVHADLGRVEWAGTRELAEEQAAHYGLRFEVVSRDQDLLDHIEAHGKFPDSKNRYCTSGHKRDQIARLFTKLAAEGRELLGRDGRPATILNCLGLRAEESTARARKVALGPNNRKANNSGTRTVTDWLPILDWTLAEVWARIKASGVRSHDAYRLGMSRLSCVFCVLASKADLKIAAKANPALLDAYCNVEAKIGHRFTDKRSLASLHDEVRSEGDEVELRITATPKAPAGLLFAL